MSPGGQKGGSEKCVKNCKCKRHANRTITSATCQVCSKIFEFKPSSSRGLFCTKSCYLKSAQRNSTKRKVQTCEMCFIGFHSTVIRKFCSKECWKQMLNITKSNINRCKLGCTCRLSYETSNV
jgi:hypothetical protein